MKNITKDEILILQLIAYGSEKWILEKDKEKTLDIPLLLRRGIELLIHKILVTEEINLPNPLQIPYTLPAIQQWLRTPIEKWNLFVEVTDRYDLSGSFIDYNLSRIGELTESLIKEFPINRDFQLRFIEIETEQEKTYRALVKLAELEKQSMNDRYSKFREILIRNPIILKKD